MTQKEMFGSAKWICASADIASPLFRAEFSAKNVKKAEITVCGLGFFELYLNGKKVSDDLLVPSFSQYNYRDLSEHYKIRQDKMSYRTYALQYDITDYLIDGPFILEQKSLMLHFRGSKNQRFLDVKKSLEQGIAVEYTDFN